MSTIWAWLLTYLVHSTLLLGAAWLVARWLTDRPRWEELVWRFAMVGALITATWQAASDAEPLAGTWRVADATAPAPRVEPAEAPPPIQQAEASLDRWPAPTDAEPPAPAFDHDFAYRPNALPSLAHSTPTPVAPTYSISGSWAAASWLTVALALAALLTAAWYALLWRLRSRVEITAGPLAEALQRLCQQAGLLGRVRLYASPAIDGPLAFGFFRPQICVPPRAVTELSAEQQELMLAHELGHVVRHDPAWQMLYRAIEWLAFFQPLHRLARRRLEDLAEELADAWAAEQTGAGPTLAGLLVQVAEWLTHDRLEVAAVGMTRRRSPLARRVMRLLAPVTPGVTAAPRLLIAGLAVAVVAAAICLPGVGLASPARTLSPATAPRPLAPTGEQPLSSELVTAPRDEDREADREVAVERVRPSAPPPRNELLAELAELDRDLSELAAEVRELRPLIDSHPSGPALRPLVERMNDRIESLRVRRESLWRIESQRR